MEDRQKWKETPLPRPQRRLVQLGQKNTTDGEASLMDGSRITVCPHGLVKIEEDGLGSPGAEKEIPVVTVKEEPQETGEEPQECGRRQ